MLKLWVLAGLAAAGSAMAAGAQGNFHFAPVPRWQEEPETEEVCAAMAKECAGMAAAGSVEAEFGFDTLYDAKGRLAGVRMTRSTGCKPLDESLLLGQRKFKLAFRTEGKPDLDDIRAEVAAGVDPGGVRIVRAERTSVSFGC